jgi:hypothetical protein
MFRFGRLAMTQGVGRGVNGNTKGKFDRGTLVTFHGAEKLKGRVQVNLIEGWSAGKSLEFRTNARRGVRPMELGVAHVNWQGRNDRCECDGYRRQRRELPLGEHLRSRALARKNRLSRRRVSFVCATSSKRHQKGLHCFRRKQAVVDPAKDHRPIRTRDQLLMLITAVLRLAMPLTAWLDGLPPVSILLLQGARASPTAGLECLFAEPLVTGLRTGLESRKRHHDDRKLDGNSRLYASTGVITFMGSSEKVWCAIRQRQFSRQEMPYGPSVPMRRFSSNGSRHRRHQTGPLAFRAAVLL